MPNLTILDKKNSLLNHFMAELRDTKIQKDRARFRKNLERIGEAMAYEISQTLPYQELQIKTPLGDHLCHLLIEFPVLITIFRAGIPFHQGFLNFFDQSKSGFIGAQRSEPQDVDDPVNSVEVKSGYSVIPDINEKTVLVIDPMIATGNSVIKSMDLILKKGKPKVIQIASVISSPEGIAYLRENIPVEYHVWTVSLDERLDERAFIFPGLGDAGDLSFGGQYG